MNFYFALKIDFLVLNEKNTQLIVQAHYVCLIHPKVVQLSSCPIELQTVS